MTKFKIDDVVVYKAKRSQSMIVKKVIDNNPNENEYECEWLDKNKVRLNIFKESSIDFDAPLGIFKF